MGDQKGLVEGSIFSYDQNGGQEAKICKRERECISMWITNGWKFTKGRPCEDQAMVIIHSISQVRKHPLKIHLRESLSIPVRMSMIGRKMTSPCTPELSMS